MANVYEEISKSHAQGGGKTDANLANDANHLGGVPAEQYATKKYVQDYHNTKEASQKEYIDEQDVKTLQEAKEYTNAQIRNQDFSTFAKLTDVQAVDSKLTDKIEECGQQCASNLATQIKAVVDDTNANFTDVNNAIGKLNESQNNLFQSVSDGKSKIAGAITDKGIPTSANDSYDTMAGNIRSIETGGGGEFDENFVNTSDGTATASDILLGKTAYVKGEKLHGGLVYPETEDSSDATATPYDILQGKTAYVQGKKIQGILNVDENSQPSYDIGAVEKIYGTVSGNIGRRLYTYENIDKYCLAIGRNSNAQRDPNDFLVFANYKSSNLSDKIVIKTLKAYDTTTGDVLEQDEKTVEYTMTELGISEEETASIITISVSEKKSPNRYDLVIAKPLSSNSGKDIQLFLYEVVYTVNRENPNDIYGFWEITNKEPITTSIENANTGTANEGTLKKARIIFREGFDVFAYIGYPINNNTSFNVIPCTFNRYPNGGGIIRVKEKTAINVIAYDGNAKASQHYIAFFANGINAICVYNSVYYARTILLDENYSLIGVGSVYFGDTTSNNSKDRNGYITRDLKYAVAGTSLYSLTINAESGLISRTKIKDVNSEVLLHSGVSSGFMYDPMIQYITDTSGKFLVVCSARTNVTSYSTVGFLEIATYEVDFDETTDNVFRKKNTYGYDSISDRTISPYIGRSQLAAIQTTTDGKEIFIAVGNNGDNKYINMFNTLPDYSEVVALKYSGDFYYRQKGGVLTAGQPDVKAGKTFIGWQGYPEVGTREVTE